MTPYLGNNINPRPDVDKDLIDLSSLHYSVFLNLVFAHLHLSNTKSESWFEDAYIHLASACDLAETVLERWYLLLLRCQDEKSHCLQQMSRKEFLDLTGKWFDEHYSELYEHYKNGNLPPIKLPSRKNILSEYYGKKSKKRQKYARLAQTIRQILSMI